MRIIPSLNSPLLNLATEPEAAALTVQQRKDLTGLRAGGKFMVIEMGGAPMAGTQCLRQYDFNSVSYLISSSAASVLVHNA